MAKGYSARGGFTGSAGMMRQQQQMQQKILKIADMLLERLYKFYATFDKVGVKLKDAQSAFDDAAHRLKEGDRTQSVVKAGLQLRELGVKLGKEQRLPESLSVDEDEMELIPENSGAGELPEAKQ